jgi:hypothetical protein
MRLLRGIAGRVLPCGCLVGIYETYEGSVVATIDARGRSCSQPTHALHSVVVEATVESTDPLPTPPQTPRPTHRHQ